jgi:hypothetical protein
MHSHLCPYDDRSKNSGDLVGFAAQVVQFSGSCECERRSDPQPVICLARLQSAVCILIFAF